MKTLTQLLIAMLLTSTFTANSQSLEIHGKFRDSSGHKIAALYTLTSNGKIVSQGHSSKIKAHLEMNQDYVLEVRQSLNSSKSIRFSTHTASQETFKFIFEVRLKGQAAEQIPNSKNIVVYFDNKLGTFTYSRI